MVNIPTTDRKYYDTGRKVNTLGAYAGAMLPAAKEQFQNVKEQQAIKIDSLSSDARLQMEEATNQWRLQNQSNPNNPSALKELQGQYDDILSQYRGQIDPIARLAWDKQANKLKGAYDLQNQAWGLKQNQINVSYDIKNAMDNNIGSAFSYGSNGSFEMALADFGTSYNKLLDYGAKNLGAETAAQMLNDYQSDYVKSYMEGSISRDSENALKELETKEVKESLKPGDYKTLKNKAENEKYKLFTQGKRRSVMDFAMNPSQENYINWLKFHPDASEDKKLAMEEQSKNGLQFEPFTGYGSYGEAEDVLDNIANMPAETDAEVNAQINEAAKFIYDMDYSYKAGDKDKAFSREDRDKLANFIYELVSDNAFKEEYLRVIPKKADRDGIFGTFIKELYSFPTASAQYEEKKAKAIKMQSSREALEAIAHLDFNGAQQAYERGTKKLINLRYEGIADWEKLEQELKAGKPAYFSYNGLTYEFKGYGNNDIFVEVKK